MCSQPRGSWFGFVVDLMTLVLGVIALLPIVSRQEYLCIEKLWSYCSDGIGTSVTNVSRLGRLLELVVPISEIYLVA